MLLKTFDVAHKTQNKFPSGLQEDHVDIDFSEQYQRAMKAALDYVKPQYVKLIKRDDLELNSECILNNASEFGGYGVYSTEAGVQRHVGQLQASMDCLETISE